MASGRGSVLLDLVVRDGWGAAGNNPGLADKWFGHFSLSLESLPHPHHISWDWAGVLSDDGQEEEWWPHSREGTRLHLLRTGCKSHIQTCGALEVPTPVARLLLTPHLIHGRLLTYPQGGPQSFCEHMTDASCYSCVSSSFRNLSFHF